MGSGAPARAVIRVAWVQGYMAAGGEADQALRKERS